MEQFTSDISKVKAAIRTSLLDYESDGLEKPIFTYYETPHFMDYAFSFHYSKNPLSEVYSLVRREWDAQSDWKKFKNGVYNLDRLSITGDRLQLSVEQVAELNAIALPEMKTQDHNFLVLDGLLCELQLHQHGRILKWNIDEEMNSTLALLVKEIRSWKRKFTSTIAPDFK